MNDLPAEIDLVLRPRISLKIAARYAGRSPRWVLSQIHNGRVPAINTSPPGKKPCWSIAVEDVRALIVESQLQAEIHLRARQNAKEANARRIS